ncbi:DUF1642 domain-containing protein [Listeria monocytogenes]|nr:DUF1642 domain-containing protein [Listeria monocytogenes]
MKFEVGERVQFIYGNELQVGTIKKMKGLTAEITNHTTKAYFSYDEIMKLDQPEPVVVPEFVAEWYEANKNKLDSALWEVIGSLRFASPSELTPIQNFIYNSGETIETLSAMKNGYVVEEEQEWVVGVIDSDRDNEIFYFRGFDSSREIFNFYVERRSEAYKFTEKEKAEAVALLIGGTVEEVDASE